MKFPKSKNHIKECVFHTEVETNMAVIEVALNGGKGPWASDMEELAKIRIGCDQAKSLIIDTQRSNNGQ
jgi:hypothetical protein